MGINKRVEVMRFSDSIFKLLKNKYPDFRCALYDYNSSCVMMATAASIFAKLEVADGKGACKVLVPIELLEKFFSLYELDFYDYHIFIDLELKASYTKDGIMVKRPLILQCIPKQNALEVLVGDDLYNIIQGVDITTVNGLEVFEQCVEMLKQM